MSRTIGLLRGVNVGGKNRMPMGALVDALTDLGAQGPQTYIQSGNFVCTLPASAAGAFRERLEAVIVERFGFRSPVALRTAEAWAAVLEAPPLPDDGALHVGFFRDPPDPARIVALDPDRSPGDRFAVRGSELYLHLPSGVGRTKLTNDWFDRQLGTVSTWRNTRTVRAIGELVAVRR